jgi:hypothetical protein
MTSATNSTSPMIKMNKLRLGHRIGLGLLALVFVVSIALTLGDLEFSYQSYADLGFTEPWQVFYNVIGKAIGVCLLLQSRSQTLRDFAFAGFFIDMTLALTAHIVERQLGNGLLAIFTLVIWAYAFVMDQLALHRVS